MTITAPTCDLCEHPIAGTAYVCPDCTARTADRLRAVVALAGEVATTVARLGRYADRHGRPAPVEDDGPRGDGGLRPSPLPFDPGASDRGHVAMTAIVTWARHAAEERGGAPTMPGPVIGPLCGSQGVCRHESCSLIYSRSVPHPVARAATYLLGQLEWLRHRPEAGEAMQELADAGAAIMRIVDAPPPLWYAGPCWATRLGGVQCTEELYARSDAGTVHCPACGERYDVADRREWLLDEADQVLAHASLIAAALSRLGQQVTASSVRNLAARRRIMLYGEDERGRPLYRVGEVRAVVEEIARQRHSSLAA